ncbi:MAG: enoyl-CoA hydratase/isomerase family protein [Planctomycetota bacterium]
MIRFEVQGQVAVITIARPERRNALTPDMLTRLTKAAQSVERTPARAIVLAGDGPAFCSGFDLSLCKIAPDGSVMRSLLTGLSQVIVALRSQPLPIVVAAHGAALAGGCALLGAADFVVTNDDAKLGYPVLKLGVSPAVSVPFLRLLAGDGVARERTLDTRVVSGPEGVRVGIAHESLADAAAVLPRALALAGELAAKPPGAMMATRRWLDVVAGDTAGSAAAALTASLSLTGGDEERAMLPAAWTR